MENTKKTAGKTAFVITDEQERRLIETTKELSIVNKALEKVSDNCGYKRFIVFCTGQDRIAVSANPSIEYFDETCNRLETIFEPQLFELLQNYFYERKLGLLEEVVFNLSKIHNLKRFTTSK